MEFKWAMIATMMVLTTGMVSVGITEAKRGECKTEAIKSGMSADDIVKTCGK